MMNRLITDGDNDRQMYTAVAYTRIHKVGIVLNAISQIDWK